MLHNQIDVCDTYSQAFASVTQKLTKISIHKCDTIPEYLTNSYMIVIRTAGVFRSFLVCSMEEGFKEAILLGMNHGKEVQEENRGLYLGEYINIICGHAVTLINNFIGEASRLTVPSVRADSKEEESYILHETMCFESIYGQMKIEINYELNW